MSRCPRLQPGWPGALACPLLVVLLVLAPAGCQSQPFDLTGQVSITGLAGDGGPASDAPGIRPSSIGEACQASSDCSSGETCSPSVPGGGYCTALCAVIGRCPAGSVCLQGSAGVKVCIKSCAGATGCRAAHVCDQGLCVPRCAADGDCSSGRCDLGTGSCLPSRVGSACRQNQDCGQHPAFCDTTRPEGYCSLPCGGPMNVRCPAGASCSSAGGGQSCLQSCAGAQDCRPGFLCQGDATAARACVPRCAQDPDCPTGQRCDLASGACLPGGATPGPPRCTGDADCSPATPVCDRNGGVCVERATSTPVVGAQVVDLTPAGGLMVGTTALTERLVLPVPADTVSINFVGQTVSDPAAHLALYRFEQSSDDFATVTRLYDYASITGQMKLAPPVVPGAFSVLYPNSPNVAFTVSSPTAPVKVGVRLLASRPTTARVTAILKRGPTRALTAGQIDLNLFFVGLTGLDATSARTDARFQRILTTVKQIWAGAQLTVGNVNYLDITGADADRYRDLDETELGQVMKLSAAPGAADNTMNVFFVHAITASIMEGYVVLGVSTGLPGVPLRGTSASGLAVTTADFPNGLDQIAETWAHEGGHWLGLFHTSESGGAAFNPLPDTGECGLAQHDGNADKVVSPAECQGRGADNLMFWTSSPTIPARNITPNQSFVLLRNPAVH